MNKEQKAVEKEKLKRERAVLNALKEQYKQAAEDIQGKINIHTNKIDIILNEYDELDDDMKSILQAQIYQKQYQEQLKAQVDAIIEAMNDNQYDTIQEYLDDCYNIGYIGTAYDLHGQGIPLIAPIDQKAMVSAVTLAPKLSAKLYGTYMTEMKRHVIGEISRGIATADSFEHIARNISNATNMSFNKTMRIVRTEGHGIQIRAAVDMQEQAKKAGADVVKQWDAQLDARTRNSHARLDGEIRELDEKFSNGMKYPSDPAGGAAEVINCRCALLQRAKWAMDEEELEVLRKRAEYFDLDKTDNFNDFRNKYLKISERERINKSDSGNAIRKSKDYAVETKMLDSREYVDKFRNMVADANVRREYHSAAKAILKHRSGQNGEDLYLYNSVTKKWYKSTSGKLAGTPEYTDEILKGIADSKAGELVAFHNHPAGMPPSASDINSAKKNGYSKGYALCHDGKIFEYTASTEYIDISVYNLRIANYLEMGYNEFDSQMMAMEYLSKLYDFTFREVK